jgi:citrate lyase synthetase
MDIINLDFERYNNVCSRLYNVQTLLENEHDNLVSQFENQTCESMMSYNERLENIKSSINDIKNIVIEMSGFYIGQKVQYESMLKIRNGVISDIYLCVDTIRVQIENVKRTSIIFDTPFDELQGMIFLANEE